MKTDVYKMQSIENVLYLISSKSKINIHNSFNEGRMKYRYIPSLCISLIRKKYLS